MSKPPQTHRTHNRKLTVETITKIMNLREREAMTFQAIGERLGLKASYVGKTYRDSKRRLS